MNLYLRFRWDDEQVLGMLPELIDGSLVPELAPAGGPSAITIYTLSDKAKYKSQVKLVGLKGKYDRIAAQIRSGKARAIGLDVASDPGVWMLTLDVGTDREGKKSDHGLVRFTTPEPAGTAQVDALLDLVSLVCSCCDVRSGGVSPGGWEYGQYGHAAISLADYVVAIFRGDVLLDHSWIVVIPPMAAASLDLSAVANVAEVCRPVDWPGGGTGAVAVVAREPESLDEAGWREWRDVLLPALVPHEREQRMLSKKPPHIVAEDWLRLPPEEARRRLLL